MSELFEYKCPCCGGALEFDSGIQKLKCPFCDSEFEVETLKEMDDVLKETTKADDLRWENIPKFGWSDEKGNMVSYICQSCGGEIIGDENTAASKCPFCDNPIVVKGSLSGELRPDYVIPFKLDKEAAIENFKKHLSGKTLLPKVFKDENHIDEIKGVYVPFWLFDAAADASMSFKATKTRSWSDSRYDYFETSHYSVFRAGNMAFERVPVDGSSKMPDDMMESIEPFDFSQAVDFQTAYLAGYLADKYDVNSDASVARANTRIKHSCEEELRRTVIGYSSVINESSSVSLSNSSYKYALYPVWILNTNWNGQKYTFAMNGQTGKFVGNLPLDKKAYFRWLCGLTAAISVGTFLIITVLGLFGGVL